MGTPPTDLVAAIDFESEATLDPTVTFASGTSASGTSAPIRSDRADLAVEHQHAFLTGATGFVGVFLLDQILRATSADVSCLVRADDHSTARERLARHLQRYGLWHEGIDRRIHPVLGDLTKPRLGLSHSAFADLANRADVIYHSAGSTNSLHSYERLKPANVLGTHEVLRLAGTGPTKPVHHLSTMAVLFTPENSSADRLYEQDVVTDPATIKGGYAQSKWVAERLIRRACERGLPCSIYRFVRVMGHSRTGVMYEMSDIFPRVFKACVEMGMSPDVDVEVTMAPVDYVTQAIVHLSRQPGAYGRTFHLVTPRPMPWAELTATVRSLGYACDELPYSQWFREVRRRASGGEQARAFAQLLIALMSPHYLFYRRPPMDTAETQQGLAGAGITCPPATPELIETYVRHWQGVGWLTLPRPPADTRASASP